MQQYAMFQQKLSKRILLVEPGYKVKYPPLGLMKIATFHKDDEVTFVKGKDVAIRDQRWDIIYITTLFTFQWKTTIDTIKFYQRNKSKAPVEVGGILASLLPDDLEKETGIKPRVGLWDEVDRLKPDYSVIEKAYSYYTNNASFAYTTKGCPNRCSFCAVHILEPQYVNYIPLSNQLNTNKKDLILLDNNVLASKDFNLIVQEIIDCGYQKDAMFGKAHRYVDFNQGLDARLLDEEKMELLSRLALRPIRIAFDSIKLKKTYIEKILLSRKYGIKHISNYILFNHKDTPDDFYERLRINIALNEEYGLNIFSFPMKYMPLDAKDRKYVGPNWTKTQLRGIQCILHATHGVVGPKRRFFETAFGKDAKGFKDIIQMPEEKIFYRDK